MLAAGYDDLIGVAGPRCRGATDGLITDWMSSSDRPPQQAIIDTLLAIFA